MTELDGVGSLNFFKLNFFNTMKNRQWNMLSDVLNLDYIGVRGQ